MNIINVGKSALKINDDDFILVQGNALRVLKKIAPKSVDVIFADPPYFLSNDGVTCVNGKMVSVNKALWDKSISATDKLNFNRKWIRYCRDALKDDGTIWISGTMHNIFSIGVAPVSYTHLDVYKRQILFSLLKYLKLKNILSLLSYKLYLLSQVIFHLVYLRTLVHLVNKISSLVFLVTYLRK